MNSFDVIVIGAGASGLIAASTAAKTGKSVCLLEKKSRPAIKLSITGKGRCNITNSANIKEFISEFGQNGKFLYGAFNKFFSSDILTLLEQYGVETKLERGGRYFPCCDDANAVVNALIKYAKDNNVKIKTSSPVKNIAKNSNKIKEIVLENGEFFQAQNYILATGGLSYPNTGSTGDGYKFAKQLGHTIISQSPALVPIVINSPYLKQLNGLKLKNVEITVFANNKEITKIFGDMEWTIFGATGPIVLNISSLIYKLLSEKKEVFLSLNLKPALTKEVLDKRLIRELNNFGSITVKNMLKELLPVQMIDVFMKYAKINLTKKCSAVNKEERLNYLTALTDMKFSVTSTRSINEAIITKGGVCIDEVEQKTMKSKLIDNLYFCGEILDLDAPTGGFNLQAAFSTGYLAGISVSASVMPFRR
ncbi:NAD(P)/FAD-dependent oxidoreductase [Candidatus Ruminimicrobium bovinum]|uniref:NAD(P)/FAD-dependent oxidoreductase n=1 Tax=Candidatus Ruminimicrobium bovinum TaxID=3242779 RepID=UPI0039B92C32